MFRRYSIVFDIWLAVSFLTAHCSDIFDNDLRICRLYFRFINLGWFLHVDRFQSCFVSTSIWGSIISNLRSAFKNDCQFLLLLFAQYVHHSSACRRLSIYWTTLCRLFLRLVVWETIIASAQEVVKQRRILRVLYEALLELIWATHLPLHL